MDIAQTLEIITKILIKALPSLDYMIRGYILFMRPGKHHIIKMELIGTNEGINNVQITITY